MRELAAGVVLSGEPLTSVSGRYVLDYDDDDIGWTAVLTDTDTGVVLWRASRPGWLYLGTQGAVQTAEWTSEVAAAGAASLTVGDEGGLLLWDATGFCLYDSRVGAIRPVELSEAAPAAAITRESCLVHDGRQRQVLTRNPDGSFQLTTHQSSGAVWSCSLSLPLARWLAQDDTMLTWRLLPSGARRHWVLCLIRTGDGDGEGRILWRMDSGGVGVLVPAASPHAYGGATLEHGGRLRHQSLTSPSGTHTLVHQDDGNLVLYCGASQDAVWATHTWWSGDGWVDFSDGDLVVRNACGTDVWRVGTSTARRLIVADGGTLTLVDADGAPVWRFTGHECTATGPDTTARGSVLHRGQTLHRQSLTSPDGSTVLVHGDRRLVLFGEDGSWLWDEHISGDGPTVLVLDEDGMLRVRSVEGAVLVEIAGPADQLLIGPGAIELYRDGTAVWRNGTDLVATAAGYDFTAWLAALVDLDSYGLTVVQDVDPAAALRRLGAGIVEPGMWQDLLEHVDTDELGAEDMIAAAFAVGSHALIIEDNGYRGRETPDISVGTFAVSCSVNVNGLAYFRVFRDGAVIADLGENGDDELTVPEVIHALAEMGIPGSLYPPPSRYPELACRIAGVRPTPADVAGAGYFVRTMVDRTDAGDPLPGTAP